MISNYTRFDGVTSYLRKSTRAGSRMVMGVPTLTRNLRRKILRRSCRAEFSRAWAAISRGQCRSCFIYPTKESAAGELSTADTVVVPARQKKLLRISSRGRIH